MLKSIGDPTTELGIFGECSIGEHLCVGKRLSHGKTMHPVLFNTDTFGIRIYSLMYILAMALGFYLLSGEVKP